MHAPEHMVGMTKEIFEQVMHASSRKVRETLYTKLGIKALKKGPLAQLKGHPDNRYEQLFQRLQANNSKEMVELYRELVRNWLYQKRPMLQSALDFLSIPNDNGLVDQELDFFRTLTQEQAKALYAHLCDRFAKEEVAIYLRFVEVPHLDTTL